MPAIIAQASPTRIEPFHFLDAEAYQPTQKACQMIAGFDALEDVRMTGHTMILTGEAQTIGAGIARALAGNGAKRMIAGLNGDEAKVTAAETARETGRKCLGMARDVSRADQIDAVVAANVRSFGGISTLVSNVCWGAGHENVRRFR